MQIFLPMELHEKCEISPFSYIKIVWLLFLFNPRYAFDINAQIIYFCFNFSYSFIMIG